MASPVLKNGIIFAVAVGALAAVVALLGREPPGKGAPKWQIGQTVDVEITLVGSDRTDLTCASATEIAGRHCAFESKSKGFAKPGTQEDKTLLQPYTTVDRVQFAAAGLWAEPALKENLPKTRFSVKCKYAVEGRIKTPSVRWASDGPWHDNGNDWYAGLLSGCTITK